MAREELARSIRELEAAGLDLREGFSEQACGHAYYAGFYAAQEVLVAAGRRAKTHAGVLQQFTDLLREMEGDEQAGKLLSQLRQTREETTYGSLEVGKEEAEAAVRRAEQVIAAAKELLQHLQ